MTFKNKFKSIIFLLISIVIIWLLWIPFYRIDKDKGFVKFHWSGLLAIFDDRPFGVKTNYYEEVNYQGLDGPYLYQNDSIQRVYYVTEKNNLIEEKYAKIDSLIVKVNNEDKDIFFVKPADIENEKSIYELPSKIIAISDIEGNFNAFSSFLISNGVINKNLEWTFDKGHLVLLGDFVDRGENVTQVLWLIYKLESEAKKSGGKVHYILGNHEIMTLQGRPAYANEKYIKIAQTLSGKKDFSQAYLALYNEDNFLSNWLNSKNAIVKIGDLLFVHGGISPKILLYKHSIEQINQNIMKNVKSDIYSKTSGDSFTDLINGKEGIFWYRGMATDYKYYDKIKQIEYEKILKFFKVKKCVIGHTINEDISTDFNKSLIKIDVLHGLEKRSKKTKGVLFEKEKVFKIDALGIKSELK
jgi:hypothetical protein